MPDTVERTSRETGRAIDVDILKRRSWSGFTAEFVRISAPALYDFEVDGTWSRISLFDLYRTDGVTTATGLPRSLTKDLRNKLSFVPAGCRAEGWCAIERVGSITSIAIDPGAQFDHHIDVAQLPPRLEFDDPLLRADLQRFQALLSDPALDLPGYAGALMEVLAFDLFRSVAVQPPKLPEAGALSSQQVRLVTEYIDAHLSERPRISDLAALVNLTRYHFIRSFKHAVGMPPHQYMIGRRVERAKEMLANQEQTIASVAESTGFGTSLQLARAFRRVVGTTPSEFRRHLPTR
ncbi:MAG: AraC family transcriptional regulator [Xanthobacteraceae bacterium]|nr:AraC family transcriptional regulator [Xanthobacteraceae bacterium]